MPSQTTIRRHERKAKGLCTECDSLPIPGRLKCQLHLDKGNAKARNTRNKHVKNGKCWICGKPNTDNPTQRACTRCQAKERASNKRSRIRAFETILSHYGSICKCCGETGSLFLTVDHINNDGAKQRGRNTKEASMFYLSLAKKIREGQAPTDLQILCYNCNCGRHRNGGICPHKESCSSL